MYRYLLHRILNLVHVFRLAILTDLASFLRAFCKKSRMSVICLGCGEKKVAMGRRREENEKISLVCLFGRVKRGRREEGGSGRKKRSSLVCGRKNWSLRH